MCRELARRVRLGAREQHEALPGRGPGQILQPRGGLAELLQALGDELLVALRLLEVGGEGRRHVGIVDEVRSGAHLRERLALDRMDVLEVLLDLLLSRHRRGSSLRSPCNSPRSRGAKRPQAR